MQRHLFLRADDGTRTRDPHLGKVMRYQLRYVRRYPPKWADPASYPTTVHGPEDGCADHNGRVSEPYACVGGEWATDLREITHDPAALERGGRWVVVMPYDAQPTFLRFANWGTDAPHLDAWDPTAVAEWNSSLDRGAYVAAVETIRGAIARGDVYQANVCRILTAATLNPPSSVGDLMLRLQRGNPAPYASCVVAEGLAIASASPELFLARAGATIRSSPIKGTATEPDRLLEKDRAENTMIVDLVRNDLGRVCSVGTVEVPAFLRVETHPGLVHLVSTVEGQLRPDVTWAEVFDATFPAGSITGAPKLSAMDLIAAVESAPRSVYCGAIGWIEGDRAELAVAIRTFWLENGRLHFGTGAGITWQSESAAEWEETELKASRLIALAST